MLSREFSESDALGVVSSRSSRQAARVFRVLDPLIEAEARERHAEMKRWHAETADRIVWWQGPDGISRNLHVFLTTADSSHNCNFEGNLWQDESSRRGTSRRWYTDFLGWCPLPEEKGTLTEAARAEFSQRFSEYLEAVAGWSPSLLQERPPELIAS